MAGMSDATKYSPSPSPTTSGGPDAGGHDGAGVVGRDQHDREQPAKPAKGAANGRGQPVAAEFPLDEVRDDLGVRLGDEPVALALQLALQLQVVLDDPVVHDHDPPRAIAVRMSVLLGRPPMRGPAGVAEPVVARHRLGPDRPPRDRESLPALRRTSIAPSRTTAMPAES